MVGLYSLQNAPKSPTKRRVFFSFHYADIMRVNNVRKCHEFGFGTLLGGPGRGYEGFYDSSLWEKRRLEGPDSLKNLIRDGVKNSSAVCVLSGSQTWARRWVRYEIARAVIDNRGLLSVNINSLNHHQSSTPHPVGPNPLDFMAVGKVITDRLAMPKYYLFEFNGVSWLRYQDHIAEVYLPSYLPDPQPGWVSIIGPHVGNHDFVLHRGVNNIGVWIDQAAQAVGR
jgi:hypothetical protein